MALSCFLRKKHIIHLHIYAFKKGKFTAVIKLSLEILLKKSFNFFIFLCTEIKNILLAIRLMYST